ncbi:predicted protein [Chaetoceros tenuissimus]|uniref:Uncharacterized protein n=1 Tax=Chaetoceros tenuissimus TaxID=426638 RepID=A0AAD3HF94_9STRA|nr:predicted protein [Chaetoceros tenuissimus]
MSSYYNEDESYVDSLSLLLRSEIGDEEEEDEGWNTLDEPDDYLSPHEEIEFLDEEGDHFDVGANVAEVSRLTLNTTPTTDTSSIADSEEEDDIHYPDTHNFGRQSRERNTYRSAFDRQPLIDLPPPPTNNFLHHDSDRLPPPRRNVKRERKLPSVMLQKTKSSTLRNNFTDKTYGTSTRKYLGYDVPSTPQKKAGRMKRTLNRANSSGLPNVMMRQTKTMLLRDKAQSQRYNYSLKTKPLSRSPEVHSQRSNHYKPPRPPLSNTKKTRNQKTRPLPSVATRKTTSMRLRDIDYSTKPIHKVKSQGKMKELPAVATRLTTSRRLRNMNYSDVIEKSKSRRNQNTQQNLPPRPQRKKSGRTSYGTSGLPAVAMRPTMTIMLRDQAQSQRYGYSVK